MFDTKELPELSLHERGLSSEQPRWSPRHSLERDLYSADNYQSYLVDSSGNAYDPYGLAWRYLGLYIDCDISNSTNFYQYYNYNNGYNRKLHEDNRGGDGECERKLLWAAYVDTKYKGNGIEEYQFYDIKNGTYDDSACIASGTSHRCVKLDCHESHTHFKLVGVFKETDGMYDWTEQLFKHEGYCIWMGDEDDEVYKTMETWMEKWPTSCKKLSIPDHYGNNLYISMHPLPEGNMTLEIYTDNTCTMLSEEMNLEAYILNLYNYYGYNNQGQKVAEQYAEAIETWNEKMSVYKICQPCRAYSLYYDQIKNSHDHRRFLENDGEGEEQERFNCYDDAGYTNVNQCYKFETKTQMRLAYEKDLNLANDQGTILKVHAFGKTYGRGGYATPYVGNWNFDVTPEQMMYLSFGSIAVVWIAMLLFFHQRHKKKCKKIPGEMGDTFYDNSEYDSDESDSTMASEYSKESSWSKMSNCRENIYLPPTIELPSTVHSHPEVAVRSFEIAAHSSSIDLVNTSDFSARGCCAQASQDDFTQSDTMNFESMDDDDNTIYVRDVNYNKSSPGLQSDPTSFGTSNNPRCRLGPHSESINTDSEQNTNHIRVDSRPTMSKMENLDVNDRSGFDTRSNPTAYGDNHVSAKVIRSKENQSLAHESASRSQPDIVDMNQSDMSSFESINYRANRLQLWKTMQQQVAQNQTQDPCIQKPKQSDVRAPEEAKEADTLGDALLRVQQRIIQSKQQGCDSLRDEMTVASSDISSIV